MITFLPYKYFSVSASVLDRLRLNKQIIEAKMILEIIEGKKSRWEKHPAILMWWGYPGSLREYINCCIDAWYNRGYKSHSMVDQVVEYYNQPWWLGNEDFHQSHRANLTRKLPEWYNKYWDEKPIKGYLWPSSTTGVWKDYRMATKTPMGPKMPKTDMPMKKMPMKGMPTKNMPVKKIPMGNC